MKSRDHTRRHEELEIKYTYRGTLPGRAILAILGALIALGGWNAYSNGEAWIFGFDQRTSEPASTPTLLFVFVGLAMILAATAPWPRAIIRRIPDWRRRNNRS